MAQIVKMTGTKLFAKIIYEKEFGSFFVMIIQPALALDNGEDQVMCGGRSFMTEKGAVRWANRKLAEHVAGK